MWTKTGVLASLAMSLVVLCAAGTWVWPGVSLWLWGGMTSMVMVSSIVLMEAFAGEPYRGFRVSCQHPPSIAVPVSSGRVGGLWQAVACAARPWDDEDFAVARVSVLSCCELVAEQHPPSCAHAVRVLGAAPCQVALALHLLAQRGLVHDVGTPRHAREMHCL